MDIEKCVFKTQKVPYLGLLIEVDSICINPQKITTITDWPTPIKLKQVQSFLRFTNFYHHFITNFSKITKPLTCLIQKDTPFSWTFKCQHTFEKLKQVFIIASVLQNFNLEKPVTLETDTSDYVTADVLSQPDEEENLHSVIFFSSKMSLKECNYKIYNKELLTIVKAFEKWHSETHDTTDPVTVLTNYKNLKYFTTTCKLNHHQAHWNEFLSEFNFNIIYWPGAINSVTDTLTHHAGNGPCNEKDPQNAHQYQIILGGQQFQLNMFNVYYFNVINVTTVVLVTLQSQKCNLQSIMEDSDDENFTINFNQTYEPSTYHLLTDCITEVYEGNKQAWNLTHTLNTNIFKFEHFNLSNLHVNQNQAYTNELKQLFIPNYEDLHTQIIESCHFNWVHNHEKKQTTFYQLDQHYWWPTILTDVKHFVNNCNDYNQYKTFCQQKPDFLIPLPVPEKRFKYLTVDFITSLPLFTNTHREVYTNVMIIVNHFSKYTTFIPMQKINAVSVNCTWLTEFYQENSAPDSIVSNYNLQFVSNFWK